MNLRLQASAPFPHINVFYSLLQSKVNFGISTGAATKKDTVEAQENNLLYSHDLETGGTAHTGSHGRHQGGREWGRGRGNLGQDLSWSF